MNKKSEAKRYVIPDKYYTEGITLRDIFKIKLSKMIKLERGN